MYTDNYFVKNAKAEIDWRYYGHTKKLGLFFFLPKGIRK